MNEFDMKAAGWDMNPMHTERSRVIADHIKKLIPSGENITALEIGAGTGTTSFFLADHLKEIIMIDNSPEMVKIMNEKIMDKGIDNLKALYFDLEHEDYKDGKFGLIFTQMVLHHIEKVEPFIAKICKMLAPGGHLAIADLYPEDGSFHGMEFRGHKGFDPVALGDILSKNNLKHISYRKCFTIEKEVAENVQRNFDLFLLVAARC